MIPLLKVDELNAHNSHGSLTKTLSLTDCKINDSLTAEVVMPYLKLDIQCFNIQGNMVNVINGNVPQFRIEAPNLTITKSVNSIRFTTDLEEEVVSEDSGCCAFFIELIGKGSSAEYKMHVNNVNIQLSASKPTCGIHPVSITALTPVKEMNFTYGTPGFSYLYVGSGAAQMAEFSARENMFLGVERLSSDDAIALLTKYLETYTPSAIAWFPGLYETDSGQVNDKWKSNTQAFLTLCNQRGILPILCTLPNHSTLNHQYKNNWLRQLPGYIISDAAAIINREEFGVFWRRLRWSAADGMPTRKGWMEYYAAILGGRDFVQLAKVCGIEELLYTFGIENRPKNKCPK